MDMYKQRGLSLVELMVSITVGLVLMAGVVQLFLSSKVTFTTQQGISRVQGGGRLAIDFISEDVRMAGFLGCANISDPVLRAFVTYENLLKKKEELLYSFQTSIEGTGEELTNENYPATRLAKTDALLVRSANGSSVGVRAVGDGERVYIENANIEKNGCEAAVNKNKNKNKDKDKYSGFCQGDIVTIADCDKVFVFQATGFKPTNGPEEAPDAGGTDMVAISHTNEAGFDPGNEIPDWGKFDEKEVRQFGGDAQVFATSTIFYYIANGTSGRPSLFRQTNGRAMELLEGVEDMQLIYGLDTNRNGVPNTFVTATEVADWDNLVAIKVELLLASAEDNVLQEPQSYTFNGVDIVPADRRIRQVFTSTIAIRSRMP